MDKEYNIYKFDSNKRVVTNLTTEKEVSGVKTYQVQNGEEKTLSNGYKYRERFDNPKAIAITSVPAGKQILNMQEDFADLDYNIYGIMLDSEARETIEEFILPDCLRSLSTVVLASMTGEEGDGCFSGCENLKKVTIPNDIKVIFSNTFKNCTKLTEVIMPDNITKISPYAFSGCSNVTLKFKNGVAPEGSPWGGTNIKIESK